MPKTNRILTLSLLFLAVAPLLVTLPLFARETGITLYEHENFRGREVFLQGDLRSLDGLPVSNDRASSIRVDRGCVAILYSDSGFRGRSIEVRGDIRNLGDTPIGNDRLSSIEVKCRGGWSDGRRNWDDRRDWHGDRYDADDYGNNRYDELWRGRRGVILFRDDNFRGRSEFFDRDRSNLGGSRIGSDRASSVLVAPGCRVTLFEDSNFRGNRVVLERDEASLGRTRVGNDRVSSLAVTCGGGGWDDGITLFEDADFRGRSQRFSGDVPSLRSTGFGNDRASSLRLARGCVAWLYEHENFRGREIRVTDDVEFLGNTRLGNDRVSSLRLECRDYGRRRR